MMIKIKIEKLFLQLRLLLALSIIMGTWYVFQRSIVQVAQAFQFWISVYKQKQAQQDSKI